MTKCPMCKQEGLDEEHNYCIVCGHKFGKQRIVEFTRSDRSISVSVCDTSALEVVIGIAQTIQIVMEGTEQSEKQILADIKKALKILRKEEKKENG